jgi:hypothetical protein
VICDRWVLGGVVGVVGYCIVSMLDDTVIRLSAGIAQLVGIVS